MNSEPRSYNVSQHGKKYLTTLRIDGYGCFYLLSKRKKTAIEKGEWHVKHNWSSRSKRRGNL